MRKPSVESSGGRSNPSPALRASGYAGEGLNDRRSPPSLAQILHSGVAHDRDDRRVRPQPLGRAQRRDEIGAGGGAGEEPFLVPPATAPWLSPSPVDTLADSFAVMGRGETVLAGGKADIV